jgi:glutamate formiminotransferase/formiminotetrahydrofolate cyclodeaminase
MKAMVEQGNPNSITDAGVGALCARAAVFGAFMNVRINAGGFNDKAFVNDLIAKGKTIEEKTMAMEAEILACVNEKIGF